LLTLTFYTIFLSISLNLLLSEVIGLKIEYPKDGTIKKIQKNIFLFFSVFVILVPLIETAIFQWLPTLLYNYFKTTKKLEVLFCAITGIIFGLIHSYTLGYQIAMSFTGIILISLTMYYSEKEKNYFWPIFFIHSINNFLSFLDF
jgi:lipoprotein signal peptidase